MTRPRHQRGDLEDVLRAAERQGWTVERGKYFKLKCPCADKHMKTIHLTPSDPSYTRNTLAHLRRATCWEDQK